MTSRVASKSACSQTENIGKKEITSITDASQINTDRVMSITSRTCDRIRGSSSGESSLISEVPEMFLKEFFTTISPNHLCVTFFLVHFKLSRRQFKDR